MGLKVIDGTPTAISKYLREEKMNVSINQCKKIVEGKFEEIKIYLKELDNELLNEVAGEMRKYLAQYSTI
ncbi:hypothetical protein LCGC14_2498330 [marine sediment metagenome]|uniref:Uncharacterized protein n=1 Tax=marine sediment metagenome TaxID=412755 RepID=A0A0F9DWH0_9ZZZZ